MAQDAKKSLSTKRTVSEAQKELEKEVKKNLRRIKRFIKSAQQRGYSFPQSAVPTLPKKITEKTLKRFQSITPKSLYKKSVYVSSEGVKQKGTNRRTQERKEAAKKAAQTRQKFYKEKQYKHDASATPPRRTALVLDTIRDMINTWTPNPKWSEHLKRLKTQDKNRLNSILNGAIAEQGEDVVAQRCEENSEMIIYIATRVLYESGDKYHETGREGMNELLQRFATIIRGKPLSVSESMEFTEYGEEFEEHETP